MNVAFDINTLFYEKQLVFIGKIVMITPSGHDHKEVCVFGIFKVVLDDRLQIENKLVFNNASDI